MQYITYKNKLKYLMKIQKIKYYNELIHLNKNCVKKLEIQSICISIDTYMPIVFRSSIFSKRIEMC